MSGRVSGDLLKMLLEDNFIQKPPPKSTGREVGVVCWAILCGVRQSNVYSSSITVQYYGESYIEKCLSLADSLSLNKEDVIATLSGG